jgi:threonine dehydrogenase-like Zn-dependent dehydrogenase
MKALTWQGNEDVRIEDVPDPEMEEPSDAIVRITSSGLCGSDLHLYAVLGPFLEAGDVLGHEPIGIVEEVGSEVDGIAAGDRVVIPFNISCGHCWMCDQKLFAQCETTQNRDTGTGASLFGYTRLYGQVPGARPSTCACRRRSSARSRCRKDRPMTASCCSRTFCRPPGRRSNTPRVPDGGSVAIFGLGPIGQMSARIAAHHGHRVIGLDVEPDRVERARGLGIEAIDISDDAGDTTAVAEQVRALTDGRGTDSAIDAVGMEAHGAPMAELAQKAAGLLPDAIAKPMIENVGVDRLNALYGCFDAVRRGGTVSISGVYGGAVDPIPMMQIFDKGLQLRMGQAHVKRWIDEIMPLVTDDSDPLGTEDFVTDRVPLADAPEAYERFQKKEDGVFKVVFEP